MNSLEFIFPIDGDMLNATDGSFDGRVLKTRVCVRAPIGASVLINGIAAVSSGDSYTAELFLPEGMNTLTACVGDESVSISVGVLPDYAGCYRVSIDDAIWFLRDITDHAYKSLFENPFLGLLKELHDTFGTKTHINIYYRDQDYFEICRMPDTYKEQWRESSDWLRLSFHARADVPAKLYKDAPYEELHHDVSMVKEQVLRFAGSEIWGETTTLHWGEATYDGCRALRDCGYKTLVADFNVDNDLAPVSYYLDVPTRRHIQNERFIWRDNTLGVTFVRSAIITDTHKLEDIPAFLDAIKENPHRAAYMDMLIHEEYFYPSYVNYNPDYRAKVIATIKWALDNGYKSKFLDEVIHI